MVDYRHQIDNPTFGGTADFTPTSSITGLFPPEAYYEHSSGTTGTFTAGTRLGHTLFQANYLTGTEISLNGTNDGIVLEADSGRYHVLAVVDTEAPAAGDATTIEVLVNTVAFGYFNVTEPGQQVGAWQDFLDTAGAAQTIELNRSSVTGTGRVCATVVVRRIG